MRTVFRKISAFIMAFVVMFSTMSFSINKHYCMDHLVDVSLVFPAETCGMDMATPSSEQGEQLSATPCCADEQIAVDGQDEVNPTTSGSVELHKAFVAAFVYTYTFLFEETALERPEFKDYSPPLLIKDLPVIYETYLI